MRRIEGPILLRDGGQSADDLVLPASTRRPFVRSQLVVADTAEATKVTALSMAFNYRALPAAAW